MVEDRDQPVYVSSGIPLHMLHIFFDQVLQNLEEELRFIEAREGFAESPLMGYREDYSQYVPRGHYTASRRLEDYFRAMMWLGRLTFLLNGGEPDGPSETCLVSEERARLMTVSALLTVSDLEDAGPEGEALLGKWKRIYELTAFFAGFVEPVPRVYAELNATLEMARRGLEEYGVLDGEIEGRFRNACSVMARLEAIAEGELAEVPMSREDAEFLKDFAFRLEATICWGGETTEGLETSLIADVHTTRTAALSWKRHPATWTYA